MSFRQGARQFFERRGAPMPPLPYDVEVEYLESTGTQWIDTGVIARLGTSLRMKFSPRVAYTSFQNCFCGAANTLNAVPHYDVNAYGGKITVWNGGAFLDSSVQISADTLYNIYVDASTSNLTVDVNGIQAASSRQDGMYSDNSFYLFALNFNGQPQRNTQIRVYSFSLIYAGVLVCDLIPVRFTNELGQSEGAMYDRVSKQLFRNQGTGAFVIGPDKTSWTNPYVNDGLVAMWDGEWNAGGGVHDAAATTWVDLSGNGYDGTLVAAQLGTAYSWESNTFVRYNMGVNGMWTPIDISNRMLTAARNATFSVQIVTGAPVGTNSWTSQIFNLARTATESWSNGITALRRNEVNGLCSSFGGPIYGTTESFSVTPANATSSVSLVLLGSTIALYDGTRLVGNKVASITPDATIAGVFARLGSSNYAYRGRYMRYAIYNRALTAAEIAANYAIDKARFNLP